MYSKSRCLVHPFRSRSKTCKHTCHCNVGAELHTFANHFNDQVLWAHHFIVNLSWRGLNVERSNSLVVYIIVLSCRNFNFGADCFSWSQLVATSSHLHTTTMPWFQLVCVFHSAFNRPKQYRISDNQCPGTLKCRVYQSKYNWVSVQPCTQLGCAAWGQRAVYNWCCLFCNIELQYVMAIWTNSWHCMRSAGCTQCKAHMLLVAQVSSYHNFIITSSQRYHQYHYQ